MFPLNNNTVKVICYFPGVGVTTLMQELYRRKLMVVDLLPETFHKEDNYPSNYVETVKWAMETQHYVFCPIDKNIIDRFLEEGIQFALVYPSHTDCETYIRRYKRTNRKQEFIRMAETFWGTFINSFDVIPTANRIKLRGDVFIPDITDSRYLLSEKS